MRYTSYKLTTLSRDIRVHPIWVTFRMTHLPDVQPAQFTLKYMYTVSQKRHCFSLLSLRRMPTNFDNFGRNVAKKVSNSNGTLFSHFT